MRRQWNTNEKGREIRKRLVLTQPRPRQQSHHRISHQNHHTTTSHNTILQYPPSHRPYLVGVIPDEGRGRRRHLAQVGVAQAVLQPRIEGVHARTSAADSRTAATATPSATPAACRFVRSVAAIAAYCTTPTALPTHHARGGARHDHLRHAQARPRPPDRVVALHPGVVVGLVGGSV